MHENEKRILEGLLFLSGDEGLSVSQMQSCMETMTEEMIDCIGNTILEAVEGISNL